MKADKNPEIISKLFDDISLDYDKNNDIISLGTHKFIKKTALRELHLQDKNKILDMCCGTGDIAGLLLHYNKTLEITGVDFSEKMLDIAKNKYGQKINFKFADVTDLPFLDNEFDIITIFFGLRNVQNRDKAIKEGYRVLKTGGEFLHLDFGIKNIFSKIFDVILGISTALMLKNKESYEYLAKSKEEFPQPNELIREFTKEGFILKKRNDYLFGIISMQIFTK